MYECTLILLPTVQKKLLATRMVLEWCNNLSFAAHSCLMWPSGSGLLPALCCCGQEYQGLWWLPAWGESQWTHHNTTLSATIIACLFYHRCSSLCTQLFYFYDVNFNSLFTVKQCRQSISLVTQQDLLVRAQFYSFKPTLDQTSEDARETTQTPGPRLTLDYLWFYLWTGLWSYVGGSLHVAHTFTTSALK